MPLVIQNGIKKLKFQIEIDIYPNGQTFQRIYPIGQQKEVNKGFIDKKKEKVEAIKEAKKEEIIESLKVNVREFEEW